MKLKTAQLREWMDAQARGEISFGKLVENINVFFYHSVDSNETMNKNECTHPIEYRWESTSMPGKIGCLLCDKWIK